MKGLQMSSATGVKNYSVSCKNILNKKVKLMQVCLTIN